MSFPWRVAQQSVNIGQSLLDASIPASIIASHQGFIFRPRYLSEWFMALGKWEPYITSRIPLKKGDTFIDVGAHIGYYSRLAARVVGSSGRVFAVEPDPRNLPLLR